MADAMLDARQEGDSYRRIEVITGQRRRRRWTAQEKARIVAESFEEGARAFPDTIDRILSWSGMQRIRIGRSWSETRRWPRINYRRCTPLA